MKTPASLGKRVRVLLVDDHDLVRAGLRASLAATDEFSIAGEARSTIEAEQLARRLKPNLILLDVRLSDGDGIAFVPRLRSVAPNARIVLLSIYVDQDTVDLAIRAGVDGFIHKGASEHELLTGLRACMERSEPWPGNPVGTEEPRGLAPDLFSRFRRLSPRERDVAYYLAVGLSNAEIAERLGLMPGTVKVNVERLMTKLELANRTQVAIAVVQHGRHRLLPSGSVTLGPA